MFDVMFPQKTDQRYYDIHFLYVLNIFKYLNCRISYEIRPDFIVTINGKDFLFDYWDKADVQESSLPTFKFHCEKETDRVFCFPPVSFYDWDRYYQLEKDIVYDPLQSFLISSRQRPYGGALKRRIDVQKVLRSMVDDSDRINKEHGWVVDEKNSMMLLTDIINQEDYWREINDIDIAVFVPGHHNQMIDRGHLQYLAFGCYTISPLLPEILPFNNILVPGVHYAQCKDDYSDLINIIMSKHVNSNQTSYKDTGENAKKLFKKTCTPEAIGKWIQSKL